ncbi:MAG: hypothetical protein AVDCRST_MAG93-360 [uncultured Chloroflexia bacterium]|uniref:Uncharacterized protein n=1 Tax=uncultured Chloroflexia bacterium TaxID=1672391 RepID=A0A6J4HDZ3_9CHLR|nr:MAG: hypothetical protein AVDCRST_MAG93-360 [uncultured Chloroflexia bacterium]
MVVAAVTGRRRRSETMPVEGDTESVDHADQCRMRAVSRIYKKPYI